MGAGLPAMTVYQSINLLADLPPSRASPLPQGYAHASKIRSAVRPPRFALILILGAPLNHAGRHPILIWGVTRQDAGLAALGHGWPIAAAPQINVGLRAHRAWARCRVVGQEPFGYFGALFQSDPPSGGTLSGRYRRNGYVLGITGSPVRPPSQASQLPQFDRRESGR